uniref:E2 ubiquitin-conjugating enzyme n=1 Tax=Corethron hystrix TaxID=216773 RepID=A0A7S1B3C1_9STRA|mmetsp:Transcript_10861/g.23858  ORF Transcript_10861/g.23858 Transcript_10861/m.23858 type:complete len:223 (+) Transcript_10861:136-804(+)|eukprot:CAMPEP_0113316716 /NCGR_PEP_ID=MMETSP0010_2-20120614/11889_1 /TAXON_ID=216773 ORGANISM="Corethron hystrix, Strain 308" /NCGR_SAMPLE_ID=MMETSP0010_2 /ASSEMBLY_ACC=CAM_ASM_000155 /LENGTH=222 /DNA_ID=CAMNT_0000173505 /DNA_START=35 /DNA_END=703 /DNA_ORIENTATION=- /assembly_acc=CAM_ASM_000155
MATSSQHSSAICSAENLPPQVLARVAREVHKLASAPPEGVKFVPTRADNLGTIYAEIEGPTGTPYEGRFFDLKLVLPGDFPQSPPRGFFLSKLYHPNINPATGDICVNTLKRDWSSGTTISHVLSVIRCLLIVPFPESSLNDECGKLFMESYDDYAKRARLLANLHGRERSVAANERQIADDENTDPTGGLSRNVAALKESKKTIKMKTTDKAKKKKSLKRL